jgi:3-hydroxyisobutyrate dehydrogenase
MAQLNIKKIGLLGIGAIGQPLAASLVEQGFEVIGYKRSDMSAFEAAGGTAADSAAHVAEQCDVILSCLPHMDAVRTAVMGEEGVLKAGRESLVLIDLNTLRLKEKEEIRDAADAAGVAMLDAPFSGTPIMVKAKQAVIFISGDEQVYQVTKPVFEALSDKLFYVGEFGTGSKMKLVANSLVGIHIVATAEAMALAQKAGLDPDLVIDMLVPSAAGSLQFKVRAPIIRDRAFEPALASSALLDKDLETICGFADDIGATAGLTRKAAEYMARTRGTDLADKDCAAVFELIADEMGMKS